MCAERMRPEHIYAAVGFRSRLNRISGVRRGDFFVPPVREQAREPARRRSERHVLGKVPVCHAGRRSDDRVIGHWTRPDCPLGEALQAERPAARGRGWRG